MNFEIGVTLSFDAGLPTAHNQNQVADSYLADSNARASIVALNRP